MKPSETVNCKPGTAIHHIKCPRTWLFLTLLFGCGLIASAQTAGDEHHVQDAAPKPEVKSPEFGLQPVDLKSLPRNIFIDQEKFFSTPFHMTASQWQWTVPLAFVGAGLLASDTAIEGHVPTNPTTAEIIGAIRLIEKDVLKMLSELRSERGQIEDAIVVLERLARGHEGFVERNG